MALDQALSGQGRQEGSSSSPPLRTAWRCGAEQESQRLSTLQVHAASTDSGHQLPTEDGDEKSDVQTLNEV